MNHTFLFAEGVWQAKGTYYDGEQNCVSVEGETTIFHTPSKWINEGFMRLLIQSPIEFKNRYEIDPFENKADFTRWESYNPDLGKLLGKFMIIENIIISTYISEDGNYSGSECMIQTSETSYLTRGFAFAGEKKLSSWAVELHKIK